MQNITDIRHHIRTVEQTRQITRAMYLISVSKRRKAISMAAANTAYHKRVHEMMKEILQLAPNISHPFLRKEHPQRTRTAYIVVSGDKGMAGAYNHNVLNLATEHMAGRDEVYIFTVGNVAADYFQREGYRVDIEFLHTAQNPSLHNSRQIARQVLELYGMDVLDEVYVVYTEMVSAIVQTPRVERLLPVMLDDFSDVEDMEIHPNRELAYEPSPQEVFDTLVPQYLIGSLYGCLVQSFASEHSARMRAMDTATRNADEMLGKLRLQYNRARQAAITQELTEIAGAAESLLQGPQT
ncbi:ATP synthase F1 subunit gamma [Christensenellaceae bacterium NSJ-44]|uniref:ATP synthase gamma chain n=1 Tax=Luoshenia tenuis TaxID=2763654 RepID=A0A926D3C6_9FIRM|nr:ATP synthase F1 subunit gamma [Luoshenia tenuis]MBC8530144.1 ATP synthase F1 subunit gamma [Luoshenia tenuis]